MVARLWWIVLVSFGVTRPVMAQTDEGMWATVSIQGKVNPESAWRWNADTLVRSRDGAGTLDFLAGGLTLTRSVTARTSVGAGYVYGAGFAASGTLFEHRFVQQVAWKTGKRTALSLRTRLEERFVSGRRPALRVRQQARFVWPLASGGRLHGIVSEELLVQSDARALAFGLDGNRLFVGAGRRLTSQSAVEIGYMNAYARFGSTRRRRHVMSIAIATAL